jgi:hypothetical protein
MIDGYPIATYDNYCIKRSTIYQGEKYRGYIASKIYYFNGLCIHLLATEQGASMGFFLDPAAFSGTHVMGLYDFNLPASSLVTSDKVYNDYTV